MAPVPLKNRQSRTFNGPHLLTTPHPQKHLFRRSSPHQFCLKVMAPKIVLDYTVTPPTPDYWTTVICFSAF